MVCNERTTLTSASGLLLRPKSRLSFFFLPKFQRDLGERVQLLNDVKQKAVTVLQENSSTLLTAGGVVGTVATAILAGRGGIKAGRILREAEADLRVDNANDDLELPTMDKFKLAAPQFIPPIVTGTLTVTSIIFANRMSAQKIAALAAAYGLAERNLSEYKEKISEKLTGPKAQQIDDEIAQDRVNRTPGHETIIIGDGDVLCFDACTGRYFKSTVEQIRAAMNSTNAEILNHDYVRASDFYEQLGLKPTTWTDETGWNREHLPELKITSGKTDDNKPYISI